MDFNGGTCSNAMRKAQVAGVAGTCGQTPDGAFEIAHLRQRCAEFFQ